MGSYQTFRGNSETKLLYVVDQLIGGINTDFSDDTSPDNEFQSIVNFTMDKRGSLFKRMGFGKLNALSQILNMFDNLPDTKTKSEDLPNPELTNDNIVYMKLIRNDNGVFRNLSSFTGEKAYREYQRIYGKENNTWELLIITNNTSENISKAWFYSCRLGELNYGEDGQILDDETIDIGQNVVNLPLLFTWDNNLTNIDTIEFFDKIYFTSNNKGLVCFDRTTKEFTYSGKDIEGTENKAYKPNPMEIRKVGFNVLGDAPFRWVDYQGLTTDSIQGIYLTQDNIPLLNVPSGGKFKVNILYTGSNANFTLTFKEGETELTAEVNEATEEGQTGLKVYNVSLKNVPTSEVEIKIVKDGAEVDPYYDYYSVGAIDPEAKAIEPLNIGDYGMCEMYNRAVYYKADTIWFSEINNFSYIPNYNYVSLPIEPTDEITKIIFFRNVYIVFTKNRIYKMIGSFGSSDFQIMPVNLSVGCHAPHTVVPVENELYFASTRGLYALKSSDFLDGIENLKELDTKVKQLTSNVTIYNSYNEQSLNYSGINENAYAIRYKDKYMLFYNNRYLDDSLSQLNKSDALVYQYELKAFTEIKFPVSPTFLFLVDNYILTYCKVPEKEVYTDEYTLVEYNFEEQEIDNHFIQDLSENNLDAGVAGNLKIIPDSGLESERTGNKIKFDGIPESFDLKNGFTTEFSLDLSKVTKAKIFDFKQSTPTEASQNEEFDIETDFVNGYKGLLHCVASPNVETKQINISWELTYSRQSTSVNGAYSGSFTLKDKTDNSILIDNQKFTFNMGSSLSQVVANGNFNVNYQDDGNYSKNWQLSISSSYKSVTQEWQNGSDVSFDVTEHPSWGINTNNYGIRIKGVAKAFNGGCNVTYTPYVVLGSSGSLYVGSRNLYVWVNGTKRKHTVGAVSSSGNEQYSGGQQTQRIEYTGKKTISIDAQYNIKATIGGTYRENLDVDAFNVTLPESKLVDVTTYVPFTITKEQQISLEKLTTSSYRGLSLSIVDEYTFLLEMEDEYSRLTKEIKTNRSVLEKGQWTFSLINNIDNYKLQVAKDDSILLNDFVNFSIQNATRDDCTILSDIVGIMSYFTIYNPSQTLVKYMFEDKSGDILTDTSGNSRNGNLIGELFWLTERGLKFDGETGYLVLPELNSDIMFSSGFKIEFECRVENYNLVKLVDFITSQTANSKCDISVSISNKFIELYTESYKKTGYSLGLSDEALNEKHKWGLEVKDTGSNYKISIYKDGVVQREATFKYGGIEDILRNINYIGKDALTNTYFKGLLFNFKIIIYGSKNPVPVYIGALYEYDTSYDDFGKPMEVYLETKGINMKYPLHVKKLKNIFVKGLGGFIYNSFFFEVYSDGHLINDPKEYHCYVDETTGHIIYDYTESKNLEFNESTSLLGNFRLDKTRFGESTYETRKMIVPSKGKNFSIKIYGESEDYLRIESFGFVCKLGKVRED